eukprot:jgi/Tetstr1/451847/TSEL_038883.t1
MFAQQSRFERCQGFEGFQSAPDLAIGAGIEAGKKCTGVGRDELGCPVADFVKDLDGVICDGLAGILQRIGQRGDCRVVPLRHELFGESNIGLLVIAVQRTGELIENVQG